MTTRAALRHGVADLVTCLRFFSRLPVPGSIESERPFGRAIRALPVAALIIGACVALPLSLAAALALPHAMAAVVGIVAGLLASGGLHEDGLADTADGFGGGATRGRKLEIMRDSRIGTYGVLALVASLLWRITALTALLDRGSGFEAALAVLGAAVVSRALALLPMALLPPARADGLAHGLGALHAASLATCFGLASVLGVALPLVARFSLGHAALACLAACLAAWSLTGLAKRQIRGHTGDVAGASQQVGEAGYWLGLLMLPSIG